MPLFEQPMQALAGYLPDGTFEQVLNYLHQYKVHFTISRQRKSVLGDYRHPARGSTHRISVNGNLNKFEFLFTLLHELAHLLTYEQFRHKVEPHGKEWKNIYSRLLTDFVKQGIFPADIEKALQRSIINPAASANGEAELLLVVRKYDTVKKEGYVHLVDIPEGALFLAEKGRVFRKGAKRRKRYEGVEVKTGLHYTFSPITEVRLIPEP